MVSAEIKIMKIMQDNVETVPLVLILSGPRRGYTKTLENDIYHLIMDFDEALHFLEPDDERAKNPCAILHHVENTFEIKATPDHSVWVNGKKITDSQKLVSDDLLEIDNRGTVFRYRIYPAGVVPKKTIGMVIADSFDGANVDGHSKLSKFSRFLSNFSWGLATQTTLWFRIWVLIILTILVISFALLVMQNLQLQRRVVSENIRIESIEEKLEAQGDSSLSQQDLLQLQAAVETQLAGTFERLEELEAGSGKASKIIASASSSVAFLIGSFGFVEPETGRLFRYVEKADGRMTRYTLEEEGEAVEVTFTGTAFIVDDSGLMLTNQHVIEPWKDGTSLAITSGRDLTPVILKIMAYFPDIRDPVPLEILSTDEITDLALLHSKEKIEEINPLDFQPRVPQPGDEVLLLGYPTGLRALVARADVKFLESITPDGPIESLTVAQQLSEAGYIKPLVSRGIVSQVTDKFIVYDAETGFGGSGGPVLDLNGRVVAINAAIIPEFGGSNMGVPAQRALYFLAQGHK